MTITPEAANPQVVTPEIVTLENLRRVTRERAFGYGVTLIVIGLLEVLWFGGAKSALQTTVEFGYNSSRRCRRSPAHCGSYRSSLDSCARARGLEAGAPLRPGATHLHEGPAQPPHHRRRLSVSGRSSCGSASIMRGRFVP